MKFGRNSLLVKEFSKSIIEKINRKEKCEQKEKDLIKLNEKLASTRKN